MKCNDCKESRNVKVNVDGSSTMTAALKAF